MNSDPKISRWYMPHEREAFLRELEIGDVIEFRRGWKYNHHAIYLGRPRDFKKYYVPKPSEKLDDNLHYVVHRLNFAPDQIVGASFASSCAISGQRIIGIGGIVLESLDDAWGRSEARINNDGCVGEGNSAPPPFDQEEAMKRAFVAFMGMAEFLACLPPRARSHGGAGDYNTLLRNCEHFANYVRCGVWASKQTNSVFTAGTVLAGCVLGGYGLLFGTAVAGAVLVKSYLDRQGPPRDREDGRK